MLLPKFFKKFRIFLLPFKFYRKKFYKFIIRKYRLTDKKSKKVAVQLSAKEHQFLIEELEMKEDIALYEKVKADKNESYMPLAEYLKKERKNNACLRSTSFQSHP